MTRWEPVENQPLPLENYNLFTTDRVLGDAVAQEAPQCEVDEFVEIGDLAGRPETIALGFDANAYPPELHTHDRFGHRIDEVRFHPAWHTLMRLAAERGLQAAPWLDRNPHAHLRRAVKFFIWSQVESGHGCPLSMTYAAVAALRAQPELAAQWEPALAQRAYDPRPLPIEAKNAALCGMAMTEKQGGSDVRTNHTRAMPIAARGPGGEYALTGHKWFCSAPMCDAFLVLAQTEGGLGCFLVPRVLADGTRNPFAIQRLKHKLGNRSNASSEVEFEQTRGRLIGEEGNGIATILEMVNYTRLDCTIGSAGLIRAALVQAIHHARYRRTFGARLIEHPLMLNLLADLALESEGATALFVRAARAVDDSLQSNEAVALKRIVTAVGKYYVCKRAPAVVGEALECLGGNGYVEESIMPRLYREAPLNSIWEGSGNINALDVVRIVLKQPESFEAFRDDIAPAREDPRVAAELTRIEAVLRDRTTLESRARWLSERVALLWQAALLRRNAPSAVADAFARTRLNGETGFTLGTFPSASASKTIVERAFALAPTAVT